MSIFLIIECEFYWLHTIGKYLQNYQYRYRFSSVIQIQYWTDTNPDFGQSLTTHTPNIEILPHQSPKGLQF